VVVTSAARMRSTRKERKSSRRSFRVDAQPHRGEEREGHRPDGALGLAAGLVPVVDPNLALLARRAAQCRDVDLHVRAARGRRGDQVEAFEAGLEARRQARTRSARSAATSR